MCVLIADVSKVDRVEGHWLGRPAIVSAIEDGNDDDGDDGSDTGDLEGVSRVGEGTHQTANESTEIGCGE